MTIFNSQPDKKNSFYQVEHDGLQAFMISVLGPSHFGDYHPNLMVLQHQPQAARLRISIIAVPVSILVFYYVNSVGFTATVNPGTARWLKT